MLQYSPYALLIFSATLVSIWLAYAIWSRRPGSGVMPFVILALGLTLWTFGSGFELLVTTAAAKLFCTHLAYIGITTVLAAWLVFILQYTGNDKWITRRNLWLLAIEPVLVQVFMFTNDWFHFFWVSTDLVTDSGYVILEYHYGTGFWLHAVYSYLLILVSFFLLIRALVRSPHLYRGQATFLLIAAFTPWIANIIYLSGFSPLPKFVDLTPLSFGVTVVALAWGLYRFRLMDIVPVARDAVIDNMDDGILVLDRGNRIVDINRAGLKLLNRTPDEVIGQPVADVLSRQQALVSEFRDVEATNTDITVQMAAGGERAFNLRISALHNRHQELTGRIIVLHDITSLKETNRELHIAREKAEEATRLKSLFLATMSHELRTPLNAIIGYTELQLMGIGGELNDKQYEYQERVLSNSRHLLGLINDILDLSKIEAGRMELVKEPFSLQAWLDKIAQENAVLAQEKGIKFKSEIDPSMPATLNGDAARLRQVVVNLISNAIKFTNEGEVNLNIHPDGTETWAIVVSDTGIGIPPHKQETIFSEFYQVDSSATREHGGTGLGLAIVRRLVLTMGGNVRVNSTLGQGSTFTVTLPLEKMTNGIA